MLFHKSHCDSSDKSLSFLKIYKFFKVKKISKFFLCVYVPLYTIVGTPSGWPLDLEHWKTWKYHEISTNLEMSWIFSESGKKFNQLKRQNSFRRVKINEFKKEPIISFWVILYASYNNMVLKQSRLKFHKIKTQWSSWLMASPLFQGHML